MLQSLVNVLKLFGIDRCVRVRKIARHIQATSPSYKYCSGGTHAAVETNDAGPASCLWECCSPECRKLDFVLAFGCSSART